MSRNYYGSDEHISGRTPIQPLPYELKELATTRELIVNYKNGDMYIVSDDGTLIDITSRLSELIQNANSSNTMITIEGLGEVKLSRLLELLWENRVSFTSKEQPGVYLPRGRQVDFKSISIKDNIIQISDFDIADTGTIPIKIGDKIYWRKASTEAPDLSAVQGDGDSIIYENGILTLRGFSEAGNNQVPMKINGVLKFITINADGSLGMTDEEKEALYESFITIKNLQETITDINETINNIRLSQDTVNSNMETMIKKYSEMVINLDNAIADIQRIDNRLKQIDYESVIAEIRLIKEKLSKHDLDINENTNDIIRISNNINSINELLIKIQKTINDHIKDEDIHSSIHYMINKINPEERSKNHLYIQMEDEYTNDLPDIYNAKLRNKYSNMGAEVQFKINEDSNFDLNTDLAIDE